MVGLLTLGASTMATVLTVIGWVVGLGMVVAAVASNRRKRLMEDLPTSKTHGVFIGLVELSGTAESEAPVTGYLSGQQCALHKWTVQEQWSRQVTETVTNSQGKTETRTKTESGWKEVASGSEMPSFYLKDDSGVVQVAPVGAKLDIARTFSETCGTHAPLYYGKGPATAVPDSRYRRRFTEHAIPLHHQLYIGGRARERADVGAPESAADERAPLYLISTRGEAQVRKSEGRWTLGKLVIGLALLMLFTSIASSQAHGSWSHGVGLRLGLYLGACCLAWVWSVYNGIVSLRNMVRQGWSQIDVQLKRRHDLIPRLVSVVQGLREHERELQTHLAQIRGQIDATAEAGDLAGTSDSLQAVVEAHPELMSDGAFLQLHDNLVDTEHRLALARGYYNEIATYFNTRLQVVPDRFVAALARLRPESLLSAEGFEREAVEVNLAE